MPRSSVRPNRFRRVMSGRRLMSALGSVSLLAGIGIGSSTATPAAALASPAHAAVGVPHLKHVFVIMLENHSYNDIMNEQDVPYLHYLARTYGFATRYYGISNASSPNRIGILSGTTARRQLPNQPGHNLPYRNIVDQLTAHRLTWGAYYQHSRFSTAAHPTYSYQKGASTFLRFKDIADNPSRVAHLQPLRRLTAALRTSKVPNFVWIAPNTLNNMEGGFRAPGQFSFQGAGPGGAGASDQALERASNNFLRTWIPRIMHSRVWHQGQSAIFVQFDETSYDASNPTDGFWLSHRGVAGSPVVPAGTLLSGNAAFPFPGGGGRRWACGGHRDHQHRPARGVDGTVQRVLDPADHRGGLRVAVPRQRGRAPRPQHGDVLPATGPPAGGPGPDEGPPRPVRRLPGGVGTHAGDSGSSAGEQHFGGSDDHRLERPVPARVHTPPSRRHRFGDRACRWNSHPRPDLQPALRARRALRAALDACRYHEGVQSE